MNDFGLSETTINLIKNVFKKYPAVKEVKFFGSRAIGNYRNNSDIDLVLYGKIDQKLIGKIQFELDELSTPFKYDVKSYENIDYPPLIDHIDRVGKIFYQCI